jgi:hypothetical protein
MSFDLNLMWYSIYKIHIIPQVGLEHFTSKTSIRVIHCQSLLHLTIIIIIIISQLNICSVCITELT